MIVRKIASSVIVLGAAASLASAGACSDGGEGEGRVGRVAQMSIEAPPLGGTVTTIAGNGTPGFSDNAVATSGTLSDPAGVAVAADGTVYVADWGNNSIRRIRTNGALDTFIAGTPNLLLNPRTDVVLNESTFPPWTVTVGAFQAASVANCEGCGNPLDGLTYFKGTGPTTTTEAYLVQEVTLPAEAVALISAGGARNLFHGGMRLQSPGTSSIKVDYLDASGGGLDVTSSLGNTGATAWRYFSMTKLGLNVNTRKIRVQLGTVAGGFDSLQLRIKNPAKLGDQAGMIGPTAVALGADGLVYIGANGLFVANAAGTTLYPVAAPAGYTAPKLVTNLAALSDGFMYVVDPTDPKLHVKGPNNLSYYADVGGTTDREPIAVAAQVQGSLHRLWVARRRSSSGDTRLNDLIMSFTCPKGAQNGVTVSCTVLPTAQIGQLTNPPQQDDIDGTAGDEGIWLISNLAIGRFNDVYVTSGRYNQARRSLLPYTETLGIPRPKGFVDGPLSQARWQSQAGLAITPDGGLVVVDSLNQRIRKITCASTSICAANAFAPTCPVAPVTDTNDCTTDTCETLAIRHQPVAVGSSCNDGNACTSSDSCNASAVCQAGPAVPTNDNDVCTVDSCNSTTGAISHTPKTYTDTDPNDCMVPKCDPANGNAMYVFAAESTPCGGSNSNRFCNQAGVCETAAVTFTPPALDGTRGTDFTALTKDLWSGASAIQTNDDGTKISATKIDPGHAGWLIGQVKSAAGTPLPNVRVSIGGDPSYGRTLTRSDGRFDLVVNGGTNYIVHFEKPGHLSVDRQAYVGWEETQPVPDVILVTADANATNVNLGSSGVGSTAFQVATGTPVTDDDGTRTAKLMLPKGITATVNGSKLASMKLRLTEYTAGPDGPARMPAALPPTSAYTYAVEISADEAVTESGNIVTFNKVTFNKPAYFYLDNFLGFGIGTSVPSGYYDRGTRAWVPSTNGVVIKVLKGKETIANGSPAEIDVTGDGVADLITSTAMTSLGFTSDELIALQTYADGTKLWRVPIDHMTPWDFNYARRFPCEIEGACQQQMVSSAGGTPLNCESKVPGSIIGCESQSLGETLPVAGTPFTLNYNSSRSPMFSNWRTIEIGIHEVPARSWTAIRITIAGRVIQWPDSDNPGSKTDLKRFVGPRAFSTESFQWDGLDVYGRKVIGSATATIEGIWKGSTEYLQYTNSFGAPTTDSREAISDENGVKIERKLRPFSFSYRETRNVAANPPLVGQGSWSLGNWTISAHHFYDPKSRLLYLGTGNVRLIDRSISTVKRVLGSGGGFDFAPDNTSATASPTGVNPCCTNDIDVAVAPNGDFYYIDTSHTVIRRVNSKGEVRTIAGKKDLRGDDSGCTLRGDGNDALAARFTQPRRLAFGPAGELYVWDHGDFTVRRLKPTGPDTFSIDTVAGKACVKQTTFPGDVPAKDNPLPQDIDGIAVGGDGALYLADNTNRRIRKFFVNGKLTTAAGNGSVDFTAATGSVATAVGISYPTAIAVGPDGTIYSSTGSMLYSVLPDGTLRLLSAPYPVTGSQNHPPYEDVPSTQDYVEGVWRLAVSSDERIVFNDKREPTTIRQIDRNGYVHSISKTGYSGVDPLPPADGAAAMANGPYSAIALALAPDGSTLAFDARVFSIYRISSNQQTDPSACGDSSAVHLIPSGDEAYCFDANGRHLSTINWRTKKKLLTFGYSAGGGLASITDPNGLVTNVVVGTGVGSDGKASNAFNIIAPYKQTTNIAIGDDFIATRIYDSAADTRLVSTGGVLTTLKDRNSNNFSFTFPGGLLATDTSPLSATPQTLARSDLTGGGFRVTHTTPLGRVTWHDVTRDTANQLTTTVTLPDLTKQTRVEKRDGGSVTTNPDLTVSTAAAVSSDPIWGMRQPVPGTRSVKLPSGLTLTTSEVACATSVSGATTTQFSAVALNPATPLVCNTAVPSNPLANQPAATPPATTPAFTNPTHAKLRRDWDANGETLTRTSREGRVITEKRDAQGRTTSIQLGTLTPILFTYDPTRTDQLQYIDQVAPNETPVRRTKLEYRGTYESDPINKALPDSDAGFVKLITDARSIQTDIKRDIFGRPLTVTEAKGVIGVEAPTGLTWDGNGSLATVTPPGRTVHKLTYDGINRLQQYTPPVLSDVPTPETKFKTTSDRVPDTEDRPDGSNISYKYVDGTSGTNTGQLDTITFPGGLLKFGYYASTETNQSLGQSPGKVSLVSGPYGTTTVKFEYNGSLPTKLTLVGVGAANEASGSVAWGYDSFFRRTSEVVTPFTGAATSRYFAYDNDNLLTCISVASGVCSTTAGSADLALTPSPEHGAVTAFKIGGSNALTETWAYSDSAPEAGGADTDGVSGRFGELRSQDLQYGSPPVSYGTITYDAASERRDEFGRIQFKTEAFKANPKFAAVSNDIDYKYNERGRLWFAENISNTGTTSEEFKYDANGNRTDYIPTPGVALKGTYDAQDRLLVYGTSTDGSKVGDLKFTYGKNGELLQRDKRTSVTPSAFDSWKYTYDVLGNLLSVETPGAAKTYIYIVDGRGRRVAKKEKVGAAQPVLKKRWLYGAQLGPIAEIDVATSVVTRFVYGSRSNVPDLVIKGTKTYRLFSDQLGSPRMAINVNDATDIPYRVDYSAFGVPTWKGDPLKVDYGWIPFGFAGGLYDSDTELVRFGARDYDASIGRWVSKDPILFGGRQANLYVYVGNDPINRRDPSGLVPWIEVAFPFLIPLDSANIAGALATVANVLTPGTNTSVLWNGGDPVVLLGDSPYTFGNQGLTFGHVVALAPGAMCLNHELQHVKQHDVLGPAYLPAHVAGQAYSWLTTGTYDLGNPLETGPYSPTPRPWP